MTSEASFVKPNKATWTVLAKNKIRVKVDLLSYWYFTAWCKNITLYSEITGRHLFVSFKTHSTVFWINLITLGMSWYKPSVVTILILHALALNSLIFMGFRDLLQFSKVNQVFRYLTVSIIKCSSLAILSLNVPIFVPFVVRRKGASISHHLCFWNKTSGGVLVSTATTDEVCYGMLRDFIN